MHPRWTSAREIVYWSPGGGLSAVTLELGAAGFRPSAPRPLIHEPILTLMDARTHYDVTRDGQRFLLHRAAGERGAPVKVLLNWTEELTARVPTK